ncbi:GNAT family N-acetyltransferase [Butyrivibrio sp. FC2001]|uniref:GNAT family N-acetyltransferase n=1 Tax=Butyrivibrio sp. FC2001 TaxID=1280671 RepID=UPI00041CDB04|nr:GNAT family N-acetyltransferase [Butyrivibrio sp. FC2001]
MSKVTLASLKQDDREQFIKDNQEAFNYGALEEFGLRDDHFEEDDQIISRETIERSIDEGEAYRIMFDDKPVGGVVIKVYGVKGNLDLLFVFPKAHSKGIGYAAWCANKLFHSILRWGAAITPVCSRGAAIFVGN